MADIPRKLPKAVIQSGEDKFSWLHDIRTLSIGELIELYAYAEAIVETVREPLVVLDKNLRVRTVNKAFFDTFRMTKEETYGKYFYDLNGGEWNISRLKELIREILPKQNVMQDFEVEHDFARIGKKIMLLNARRIILDENNTELILLAVEDITERRQLERRKDEFVRIASHELRAPLQIVQTASELLKIHLRDASDQESISLAEDMHTQTRRLKELIDRLLRAEVPHANFLSEMKKFDLSALARGTVREIKHIANGHSIAVKGVSKITVRADAEGIQQVLVNLLANALKYSRTNSEIILTVEKKGNEVLVGVRDHGIGINKKELPKIFEQFYKAAGIDSTGFGLGLYIAAKIIQEHKGRIWAESTKGKGSTFYFSLPLIP